MLTPRMVVAVGLAGSLLLAGCSAAHSGRDTLRAIEFEQAEWTYRGRPGLKVTTAHYEIFTTLRDEEHIATLPGLMERAFEEYAATVPPAHKPAERMKVYLFATRAEWADFTRQHTGSRAGIFLRVRNGGYCERGVSVIQYTAHQTTFPLMAHEGFHQYLHHYVNDGVPAWLNEGLAVLFEGQKWNEDGLASFDPWHNPTRRNTLADALLAGKLFPLSQLLETNAGKVLRLSSKAVGTYYAQLWGLMLFLREGENGRYRADFDRLLASLGSSNLEQYAKAAYISSDAPAFSYGEELFRCFITDDLTGFETEYHRFLRTRLLND